MLMESSPFVISRGLMNNRACQGRTGVACWQPLDAPAVPTHLLRAGLDAVWRDRFAIGFVRLRKRVLFVRWAVADALQGTISVRRTRLVLIDADKVFSVFILSGRPARLADVYERRAATILSTSFLIGFFLLHIADQQQG